MRGGLRPDDEDVGDRRVRDPHLAAGEAVAARHLLRARDHRRGIGAVVRLGEAEAADPLAGGQLRQVLLLLRLGAELVDRHHHQRALHAHHRAVAGIDALDLARDQPVADEVETGAAVFGRDGRAEQAHGAHFAEDGRVGLLVAERVPHARQQLALAIVARRVADHALVRRQLRLEQ